MDTDHRAMSAAGSIVLLLFDTSRPIEPNRERTHQRPSHRHLFHLPQCTAFSSHHHDLCPALPHNTVHHCLHYLFLAVILCLLFAIAQGSSGGEPYRASANLGENVVLRCVFDFPDGFRVPYVIQWEKQGIKIPIYIWYDGYPPHIGEGYEGRVGLTGQASLNLSNVRESDQGWYECKVFFLNRPPEPIKNGTWVHLDVLAPPQFRLKPPDVIYVKVGESITLPCEAIGTPTPQIVWYKDNRPLQSSANVHILTSELRISSIQLNDIGEYRCTSRNREGSITTSTKIIIAGPAVITLPPRNMTKLEGDRVEFICEAKALPSNVTHRWFHNGVEISHLLWMENRVAIKHGMLLINPSIAEDSGRYTCEVSNGIGLPETAEAYLNIEYPARVIYSPTIQYLPFGLSGIVRCFIQASPPFQLVTWTKDRRPFDPNSNPGVVTLTNGSLLFNRVSHEHQGIYRCTAYNIHGSSEPSQGMEVLVRDPPTFTTKSNDVYVRSVNEEVSLPCDGAGQPKPNIFWRKADGSKLSRERSTLRSGNLTIKLLKKEDHGRYECVVENEIATIVAASQLIVNNTTPHTPTKLSVNASYFAATVHWEPNYNGGYEQTFHLSYRISDQGDAEWKTIRVPPPETTSTFTLYNLQSDTEYEFQVYASNRLGAGLPTQSIRSTTKVWSFGEKIYPTDASGATYIPTVQKPSGPRPDAPRNLTLEKMAQGWVLSWLAPLNRTVAVAYYRVEFRPSDKNWQYTDPIPYDTAYLFKNLESNSRYIFRVWAYSILGVGEVSEMIEVSLTGMDDSLNRNHALTASIVGGVCFFIALVLGSICLVKSHNKQKRRKIEKSYMMVTCPVNGTTSYSDSPVPSKHSRPFVVLRCLLTSVLTLCRRYSPNDGLVLRQQHYDDQYDHYRDYWQRPAFGSRIMAGRSGTQASVHARSQGQQVFSTSADVHHDDAYYWRFRDEDHPTRPVWSGGQSSDERPVPPPRRRAMKNLQYSVESGLVQPFDSHFAKSKENDQIAHNYDLTPSNQASARGSFRSDGSGQSQVRRPFSQLSYAGSTARVPSETEFGTKSQFVRSTLHSSLPLRPQTLMPFHQRQVTSIYQPQDPRFQTSSPTGFDSTFPQSFGNFSREFSSIRQASTLSESKGFEPSRLSSQLRELPSLRPIHEQPSQQGFPTRSVVQPFYRATQDNSSLRATIPIGRSISHFAGRALSRAPLLESVPEAIYDSAPVQSQRTAEGRPRENRFNPYQNLPVSRQLLLSSPIPIISSTAREPIRRPLPVHPTSSMPRTKKDLSTTSSSDSSSEQFEYTRDKLLGAVEKVRSGYLLSRGSPLRHTIEGHYTPRTRTPVSTPVPSQYRSSPLKFIEATGSKTGDSKLKPVQSATYQQSDLHYPLQQSHEASHMSSTSQITPHFYGRSPHSFVDTSQLSLITSTKPHSTQSSITSKDISSQLKEPSRGSSGFISGTMSSLLLQPSLDSPSHSSGLSAEPSTMYNPFQVPYRAGSTVKTPDLPSPPTHSEVNLMFDYPVQGSHSRMLTARAREPIIEPLDVSVDDNYEFDSASPMDAELIDKLRREQLRWRHWQTWQRERNLLAHRALIEPSSNQTASTGRGPLSDTEIYGTIAHRQPQYYSYRMPRNMTIEDMEARCAALRQEFLNFRHRQAELEAKRNEPSQPFSVSQAVVPVSTSSSDEFESAC